MPTDDNSWRDAISAESRPSAVTATTVLKDWPSSSRPVLLSCSDDQAYIVKGRQNGRMLVNEHIVGRIGGAMGAPVPEVGFVDVPQTLISVEPRLSHFSPGVAHGSRLITGVSERQDFIHTAVPQNRIRFALLLILFSWMFAGDHQFIYQLEPPNLVYSMDHGNFFPGAPAWTIDHLSGQPSATLDSRFDICAFTQPELYSARLALVKVTENDIAAAVAGPPDEWGMSIDERIVMAKYLTKRKGELLQFLPLSI